MATEVNMEDRLKHFAAGRHKFIWFTKEIETYPEVLVFTVDQTRRYYEGQDLGIADIGYFATKKTDEMDELFCLYISARRFHYLFSLYKQYREEYHSLTTGYFSDFDLRIESMMDISPDAMVSLGLNPDIARQNVEVLQSYRRPITRFETLANKSLNRRRAISVGTRYKVLARDKSTCQVCGRSAPEVTLEVDHIRSVFDGGGDDMENLWTTCRECNRGKGPSTLWEELIERLKRFT